MTRLLYPETAVPVETIYAAPTGNGDGTSPFSPIALVDAILQLRSRQLGQRGNSAGVAKILLASGTYNLAAPLVLYNYRPQNLMLRLEGSGASAADAILSGSGSAVLRAERSVVSLLNLTVQNASNDAIVAFDQSSIIADNLIINAVGFDAFSINTGSHLRLGGSFAFGQASSPLAFVRLRDGSDAVSTIFDIDYGNQAIAFGDGVIVSEHNCFFSSAAPIAALNNNNVSGPRFKTVGNGRIVIDGKSFYGLNDELPGDELGEFEQYRDDPSIATVREFPSDNVVDQLVRVNKKVAFDMPPNTGYYFRLAEPDLELVSLAGEVGFTSHDGTDGYSNFMRMSALFDNRDNDIPTGEWILMYSGDSNSTGSFTNLSYSWYTSGTLSGTNGNVDQINFSTNSGDFYINNRYSDRHVQVTFDLTVTHMKPGQTIKPAGGGGGGGFA